MVVCSVRLSLYSFFGRNLYNPAIYSIEQYNLLSYTVKATYHTKVQFFCSVTYTYLLDIQYLLVVPIDMVALCLLTSIIALGINDTPLLVSRRI